jgi:hypothetical protein
MLKIAIPVIAPTLAWIGVIGIPKDRIQQWVMRFIDQLTEEE